MGNLKFVMNYGYMPVYSRATGGLMGEDWLVVHADAYKEFDADGNSTLPSGFPTKGQVLIVPEGTDHIERIFYALHQLCNLGDKL